MLDALFWWTGVAVWAMIVVIVMLYLPIALGLLIAWAAYKLSRTIQNQYYDGEEDVERASEDGVWHFYVSDWLISVRDAYVSFAHFYVDRVLEPTVGRVWS